MKGQKEMRQFALLLAGSLLVAIPQQAIPQPAATAVAPSEDARLTAFLDAEFAQDLKLRPQLATRLGMKEGEDKLDDISDAAQLSGWRAPGQRRADESAVRPQQALAKGPDEL